jgi:sec-independent protein translocase protein TatC
MTISRGHLEELRQRLLISFLAILVFSVIAYIFSEQIARFFMIPLFRSQPALVKLVYTNLTEAFISYLKVSLLVGITCSIPVLIYEIWMFISPGLHQHEKRVILKVVFWASLLFAAGACFAFFIVLPRALNFLMGFAGPQLTPLPKLGGYLTFVARASLGFGLAFEIPFLMVAAVKTNFVKRKYFTRKRKYFYPGILFLALLLAAGDLMAAVLLALPLCGLYETGILVINLFTREGKDIQNEEEEKSSE